MIYVDDETLDGFMSRHRLEFVTSLIVISLRNGRWALGWVPTAVSVFPQPFVADHAEFQFGCGNTAKIHLRRLRAGRWAKVLSSAEQSAMLDREWQH